MKSEEKQQTHLSASIEFVGKSKIVDSGRYAEATLTINNSMIVDDKGLAHGGFTFGLADYAAMIAVNHPNVVLGSSNVKFLKPVVYGDELLAKAQVIVVEDKKRKVWCEVFNQDNVKVFEGEFFCITLNRHILDTYRDRKS